METCIVEVYVDAAVVPHEQISQRIHLLDRKFEVVICL